MYICMIYIYLTKQVNRLKLVNLQTTTSDLAKLYTMDKFGAESCPMVKTRNHKIHSILWNACNYLKGRIMEIGKYLHTVILRWRSRRPLEIPPGMGYIRETGIVECQSGPNHSHPMHLGPLVWAPRSFITRVTRRSLVTRVTWRSLVTRVTRRSLVTRVTRRSLVTRVALRTLVTRVALRSLVTTVHLCPGW